MGRNNWKKKQPPFVMIVKYMLRSKAWQSLSNPARVAYVHLKAKYNGSNGKDLSLTYSEMEPYMSRRTFSRAIKQLINCGFIELVQHGGLMRSPNIYALADDWKSYPQNKI